MIWMVPVAQSWIQRCDVICIGEVMLMDTPDMFYFVGEMSNLGMIEKEC